MRLLCKPIRRLRTVGLLRKPVLQPGLIVLVRFRIVNIMYLSEAVDLVVGSAASVYVPMRILIRDRRHERCYPYDTNKVLSFSGFIKANHCPAEAIQL